MAQVRYAISIDEDLIPVIADLGRLENRNPSNMTETLIREALAARQGRAGETSVTGNDAPPSVKESIATPEAEDKAETSPPE